MTLYLLPSQACARQVGGTGCCVETPMQRHLEACPSQEELGLTSLQHRIRHTVSLSAATLECATGKVGAVLAWNPSRERLVKGVRPHALSAPHDTLHTTISKLGMPSWMPQ